MKRSPKSRGPKTGRVEPVAWRRRPAALYVVVALAALVVYANSVPGEFVFDDTVVVQGNKALQGLDPGHLREIFGGHYWKTVESRGGLYRPVVMLSYALNHALTGDGPKGYHAVNVLLHAANGVLVASIMQALFARPMLSLLTALLFVLHPIRTEAVASIVGRAESLSALFMLVAWLAYVRFRTSGSGARLGGSAVCFGLAALTKESAFCFPALLLLTDFVTGQGSIREKFAPRPVLARYWPYAATGLIVLMLRYLVLGGLTPLYINPASNPLVNADTWQRFLTATHVFAKYIGLLVLPWNLSADYSYNQIPLVTGIASGRGIVPLLLLFLILVGIGWSYARNKFLFFCGILFFSSYILTSNWLRPIGTIMAERLMYFPALGFNAAVAFLLVEGLGRPRWKSLAVVATCVLIVGYAGRAMDRNLDWRNHPALFSSAVRTSPNSGLVQSNYAIALLRDGKDPEGAVRHARRAVEIQPDAVAAYFTLGKASRKLENLDEAVEAFSKVVELAPRTSGGSAALRDTAEIHLSRGRKEEARAAYEKLVEWRPTDASALLSLARICNHMGDTARARTLVDRASRLTQKP